MSTVIRSEISKSNPYWISKHRYYELKHLCLQYSELKKEKGLILTSIPSRQLSYSRIENHDSRCVEDILIRASSLDMRIEMIRNAATESDKSLADYILLGVTEGLSYEQIKARLEIPCGKDMYYDRYRRFFWLLDSIRG